MTIQARRPPFFLGIDLGGTNIKSGVVDDAGKQISAVSVETHAENGPEAGVRTLAEAGRLALKASGLEWSDIAAVGLGSPGTMDIEAGMLLDPPNLPGWHDFPIRDRLAAMLERPVVFQNDANAAAFGEYWAGAGRGSQSLVLFTLGTGIGCGIVEQGRIVEGRHSHGAECGHLIIQMEGGREHPPGYFGRLEAYASATALVKRAVEALEAGEPSVLQEIHDSGGLSARAVDQAARRGDALANRLMNETARYLAVGATCLMHTIDPDIILFAGGMIAAGTPFLDVIRAEIRRIAFPVPAAKTRVEFAELGGDAGFIGAAGCARAHFART
ncbi:MAG: transcriptional regulator/sugar kinase [Planctomycetota bacterium]|nr:transcriptional regulator/sugar kinase [Planctomycetota bacterium]